MNDLDELVAQAGRDFAAAAAPAALEDAKARYLGKAGRLTELLKGMAALSHEDKKTRGAEINQAKQAIEAALSARRQALAEAELEAQLKAEALDVTLPGRQRGTGGLHPVSRTLERMEALFGAGLDAVRVHEGPEPASVGALAMGSSTYEWILRHEAAKPGFRWPYAQPTWVFTTRDLPRVDGDVRFVRGDVVPVHTEMAAAAGERDVWLVGGGELVGRFADAGLLDRVLVSIAPVTLGAGAPLLPRRLRLRVEGIERNRDFACVTYGIVGPEPD